MPEVSQKIPWLRVTPEPRAAGDDAAQSTLDEDFERFQLRSLALQAQRVMLPVLAVSAVIAWLLPRSYFELSGWILWLLVAILMICRWRISRRYLLGLTDFLDAPTCQQRMLFLNFAIGLSTGGFCWLAFPGAGPLQHAAITTLLVGLAAGAVATCASSRRSFVAYALPLFLQLALAWILFGQVPLVLTMDDVDPDVRAGLQFVFAAAIATLFWVLVATCNDSERWIRNFFKANLTNQHLVSQLRDANLELHKRRESAIAANQAKTRFLAAASHDLRQPLHALSLYSASLSLQKLPARALQLADAIQDCVSKSLAPLLDALLDVSKLDAKLIVPRLEGFILKTALSMVRQEFQARCDEKGLGLQWDIPAHCAVVSDSGLLVQIVRNLLDNALKYTLAGSISLRVVECNGKVQIEASDTGLGIDATDLPRVFEEFYQCGNTERDRSKGLGLGLAIVKRLCDLLGIDLSLESTRHVGTWVRLGLSAATPGAESLAMTRPMIPAPRHLGMRILVIDNEQMVRDSTRSILQEWGCEVRVASCGQEALRLAQDGFFDVFLADYRLNASENGLEVLIELCKIRPEAACWLITGETGPLPWAQLRERKIGVLHKPLQPQHFLQALGRLRESAR
jgi:two-component system, sensor histidine kinase